METFHFCIQPKAPENQTSWNSDSQGIKEKINQTGKAMDRVGRLRKNTARQGTVGVALAAELGGL